MKYTAHYADGAVIKFNSLADCKMGKAVIVNTQRSQFALQERYPLTRQSWYSVSKKTIAEEFLGRTINMETK